MSLFTGVLIGLAVWLLVLVAIMLVFVLRTRHRRQDEAPELEPWRAPERRRSEDRRIGLPDPRPVQLERRRGPNRRRRGIAA